MGNVRSWSANDVKVWISGIGEGYTGYADEMLKMGVNGSDLIANFDEVMAEIQFSKPFHRVKLQKAWKSIVDQ